MTRTALLCIAAFASAFATLPAQARDQGIINQTSMYERSLSFYLHPAGYFFEHSAVAVAPLHNVDHPAVQVHRAMRLDQIQVWTHPALRNGVSRSVIAAHGE